MAEVIKFVPRSKGVEGPASVGQAIDQPVAPEAHVTGKQIGRRLFRIVRRDIKELRRTGAFKYGIFGD